VRAEFRLITYQARPCFQDSRGKLKKGYKSSEFVHQLLFGINNMAISLAMPWNFKRLTAMSGDY
jgi:hypothetical protein